MIDRDNIRCATCLAFHQNEGEKSVGTCRFHAPAPDTINNFNVPTARWPIVTPRDWCRQYERNEFAANG